MTTKTTTVLKPGQTNALGTSLGSQLGGYPNSALYWNGTTPGWASGDLANYNQQKLLLGRKPDATRHYQNSPDTTTGITGSAGAYGLIEPDWRDIANDGAMLFITIKTGTSGAGWQTLADNLNAAGSNADKTKFNNICQNLKRWHDDTGNTATRKKIIFGWWHEPSKVTGFGPAYIASHQAVYNYMRTQGVSDGPKPASGPGSAYVGTWYDMLEWAHVAICFDLKPSNNYAFYPGDAFCTWLFADGYNWAGGQNCGDGTSQIATDQHAAKVPQPGRTIGTGAGNYSSTWNSMQVVAKPLLDFYKAGAGGSRDVLLGLGECAASEDIDRFTVGSTTITAPQTHTGVPHKKGDWYTGLVKWIRGEAYTAATSDNNVSASTDGPLIKLCMLWPSETSTHVALFNTIPFQPGDTTGPSTAGAAAHYTYDAVVAAVNDNVFSSTPIVVIPPTNLSVIAGEVDAFPTTHWQFDTSVTQGSAAIVSYTYAWGDGTSNTVDTSALTTDTAIHDFPGPGAYTVTITVLDAGAQTATLSKTIFITPAAQSFAHGLYIQTNDDIDRLGLDTYNPTIDAFEAYMTLDGGTYVVAASGAAQTLPDPRLAKIMDVTLTANCAITLPTAVKGMRFVLVLHQDGVGSRTASWVGTVKWPAATAPVITTTISSSDEIEFICERTGIWRGKRIGTDMR